MQCAEIVVAGGAAPEFLRRDGVVDGGQRRRRVRRGVFGVRGRGGEGEEGEEEDEAFHRRGGISGIVHKWQVIIIVHKWQIQIQGSAPSADSA